MENKNLLQELKKIKRVEAPPFLFTRIEQKIHDMNADKAPLRLILSLATTFCLLLVLNLSLLNNSYKTSNTGDQTVQTLIEEMNMNYSNHIYYE